MAQFYYAVLQYKKTVRSSLQSSNLAFIGALKWGTVWSSMSIGIKTKKGQSWMYIFLLSKYVASNFDPS